MRGSSVRHVTAGFAVVLATALVGMSTPQALAIVGPTPGTQIYFVASMQNLGGDHLCGGTLVAARWVLTAKRCVTDGDVGRVRTGSNYRTFGGSLTTPERVYPHPTADLALVLLTQESTGRPVVVATTSPAAGTPTTIMGWGTTCEPGGPFCTQPNQIQTLRTSVLSDSACLAGSVTTLCTDNPNNSGNCTGDDGGPQVTGSATTSWVLVGSAMGPAASGCGAAPSTYVDVTAFDAWITQVTSIR